MPAMAFAFSTSVPRSFSACRRTGQRVLCAAERLEHADAVDHCSTVVARSPAWSWLRRAMLE